MRKSMKTVIKLQHSGDIINISSKVAEHKRVLRCE